MRYGEGYAKDNHPHAPQCYLKVVGFPCNQFGLQEPAHNDELLNGLKYVRPGNGYVPGFNISTKIDVNGKKENKIFTFLKSRCPPPKGIVSTHQNIPWTPIKMNDVSWNFQKWLIDSNGHPFRRYESDYTPEMMESDILALIEDCVVKAANVRSVEKLITKRSKKVGGKWKFQE